MIFKLFCLIYVSILLLVGCQSETIAPTETAISQVVSSPTFVPITATPLATFTPIVEEPTAVVTETHIVQVATDMMTSTNISTSIATQTATITPIPTQKSSAVLISVSTPIPAPPPLLIEQREQTEQVIVRFNQNTSAEDQQRYIESIGATIEDELQTGNAVVLRVDPSTIDVNNLPKSNVVVSSEPDYFVYPQQTSLNIPPSDSLYSEQWGLQMLGVESAWQAIDDNTSITVAVIDSGICYNHPDLSGKIIDGWDFIEFDNVAQDDIGHGCGVAGVIAATIDNEIGIAGIAPNVQVLPLRVLNASGLGTVSDTAEAFRYATDNGADIINASLGTNKFSTELQLAVEYALSKGVKIVAAVGNYGNENEPLYPARFDGVIKVGAVESNGVLAPYSHSGYDWLAPGSGIITTHIDNAYRTHSGTSFAAPHVTGALALQLAGSDFFVTRQQIVLVTDPTITPTHIPPTITPTYTSSPQVTITEDFATASISGTKATATPSATISFSGGGVDGGELSISPTSTNQSASPTVDATITATTSPTTSFEDGSVDGGGASLPITPTDVTITPSVTPAVCREDVNFDGVISILDIQMVAGTTDTTNTTYDVNQDGLVNILDTQAIAGKIGQICGA